MQTRKSLDEIRKIGEQTAIGKYGFVSHTKHTAEATNTDLLHSGRSNFYP